MAHKLIAMHILLHSTWINVYCSVESDDVTIKNANAVQVHKWVIKVGKPSLSV